MSILTDLSERSGIDVASLYSLSLIAPRKYLRFLIPKRNGREMREVAQPSREVKYIQNILVKYFLNSLPIHSAATAYVKGKSIRSNATPHCGSKYLLKLDFKNFFPSIKPGDLLNVLIKNKVDLSSLEWSILSGLLFWIPPKNKKLQLCVGAPSSPIISNAVMYDFDAKIFEYCCSKNVSYTRYADDIAISANVKDDLNDVNQFIIEYIKNNPSPYLFLNSKKRVFLTPRESKKVTGVQISDTDSVYAGRDRKRLIRSMLQREREGLLGGVQLKELAGLISFVHSIEPDYIRNLKFKYGQDYIVNLLKKPFEFDN